MPSTFFESHFLCASAHGHFVNFALHLELQQLLIKSVLGLINGDF